MEALIHALRWAIEQVLRPLDALVPAVSLAVIALVTAVLMLLVIRRTSPQRLIEKSRAQITASIYEMRLYLDHPSRLFAAQGRMLGWSVIYMLCLLPAMLVLTLPLGLLLLHLEPRHGLAPLEAPSTVIVRIEVDGVSPREIAVEPTGALELTAPLVRAEDEGAVYARVAIRKPGTHRLVVRAGDETVTKQLVADPDASVVAPERSSGFGYLWSLGAEAPAEGAIRSIAVPHPDRDLALPMPWWLYWLLLATVFALLLRRRFDVAL